MAAELRHGVVESGKLLSVVTEIMAKKDVAMGDLLQLMDPSAGKGDAVESCSDAVEALQTQLDESVTALRQRLNALKELSAALPTDQSPGLVEKEHEITATRAGGGQASSAEALGRGDRDAVEDLQRSLQSATMREKERVEGLQAQLELARHELSECRNGRRLEQSALVTAESQATQLRTALACAEEDMKALREALDQELLRGHRLQSRLLEIQNTGASYSRSSAAPSRANESTLPPDVDGVAFDEYMARRATAPARPAAGGGRVWPASAKTTRSGDGHKEAKHRPSSVAGHTKAPAVAADAGWQGTGVDSEISRRQHDGGVGHSRGATVGSSPLGSSLPRAVAPPKHGGGVVGASVPSVSKHGSGDLDRGAGAERRKPDSETVRETSLADLRAAVVSGHVTKTTKLELRVEYCGRKSFSVRHKEEKYTLLAEQAKTAAFDRFKDRWMTVVTVSGEEGGVGGMPQPTLAQTAKSSNTSAAHTHQVPRKPAARLGAFEMELLWCDALGRTCCTVLHSKLSSRVFPRVPVVLDALAEALDPTVLPAERI